MTVNLSIKNVPDEIAERLRRRAATRHRSLQGEDQRLTLEKARRLVRELDLHTPDEAREMIRADRNAR